MDNEYKEDEHIEQYDSIVPKREIIKKLNDLRQEILSEEDYQKYLKMPANKLETPIFNQVMVRRLNELREEYGNKEWKIWLEPLVYDENLEKVAEDFGKELQWTRWREKTSPHQSEDGSFVRERIKQHWLKNYIARNYEKGRLISVWENIVSNNGSSIEGMLEALMRSPGHRKAILSKTNIVGFSHTNPIVQVFAYKNMDNSLTNEEDEKDEEDKIPLKNEEY